MPFHEGEEMMGDSGKIGTVGEVEFTPSEGGATTAAPCCSYHCAACPPTFPRPPPRPPPPGPPLRTFPPTSPPTSPSVLFPP